MKTITKSHCIFKRISSVVFSLTIVFGGLEGGVRNAYADETDPITKTECEAKSPSGHECLSATDPKVGLREKIANCTYVVDSIVKTGGCFKPLPTIVCSSLNPPGTCKPSCELFDDTLPNDGKCTGTQKCCVLKIQPECETLTPSGTCKPACDELSDNPGSGKCTGTQKCCVPNGGSEKPPSNNIPTKFENPLQYNTVQQVLDGLLSALRGIIVILSIIFIVIGAVLYITSAGNSKQTEMAKSAITAAMIGLAIGIAAPSFLKEISGILGWNAAPESVSSAISLTQILTNVLKFLTGIVGILSIIMLVIGALMILSSAGSEDRIEDGKKIVKYSIIGIVVAFAALIIVKQIASLFL